jgi:uncharacterized membrane protein YoaK (UPF0700 family)
MLRHTGQKRSFKHNLRLAILLCLNAGFINAAGFLAFQVLTTNVTGHAALLAVDIASPDLRSARIVALWLILFLAGAFSSGLIISRLGRDKASAYAIPILIITFIVSIVALLGNNHTLQAMEYYAGSLLFAMGMQNALVSLISGSEVRTTHLTGMFTDLGTDLSASAASQGNTRPELRKRILLRLTIISFFLLGGIIGGLAFSKWKFHAFFIPVSILITALFYDYFRVYLRKALRHKHENPT